MTAMDTAVRTAEEQSEGGGLALDQLLCTPQGPAAVGQIVSTKSFAAVGYDADARGFIPLTIKLRAAAKKPILRIHTDKGSFVVAAEQRLMLEDGACIAAAELEPGMRLRACTLWDGNGVLVEGEGDFFRVGNAAPVELIPAECAVANWYPVPSVERLGIGEVAELEVEAGAASSAATPLLWITGASGGVGIVVAAS